MSEIPNIEELSDKAEERYRELTPQLKNFEGQYIAIDVESGDYFTGETREEAVSKAKEKYPSKLVFVRRIGAIEKISRHVLVHSYPER